MSVGYKMQRKHRKHFCITLLISFTIHLFILTVLFTTPDIDDQGGYKKIRVKLGIKNKSVSDNISSAEKYASFKPGTGANNQQPAVINNINNIPPIAEPHIEQVFQEVQPPKPSEDNVTSTSDEPLDKEKGLKAENHDPQIKSVATNAASNIVSPPQYPAVSNPATPQQEADNEDEGTVIGNSSDKNADKLATYEQMLPLWLDKFKRHPTDDAGTLMTGKGEVFIKIDRNGKVLLSKVIKTTGSLELDKALMQMIADADPVLPVPLDYYVDKKTFSYKIEFEFQGQK